MVIPANHREGLRCSGVPARLYADSSGSQAHANRKKSWGLGDKGSSLINSAICPWGSMPGCLKDCLKASKVVQRQKHTAAQTHSRKGSCGGLVSLMGTM